METEQIILIVAVLLLVISLILNIVVLVKMKKTEAYVNGFRYPNGNSGPINIPISSVSSSPTRLDISTNLPSLVRLNLSGGGYIEFNDSSQSSYMMTISKDGLSQHRYLNRLFQNTSPVPIYLNCYNNVLTISTVNKILGSKKITSSRSSITSITARNSSGVSDFRLTY